MGVQIYNSFFQDKHLSLRLTLKNNNKETKLFKKLLSTFTGHWHGVEVHDQEKLTKIVLWSLLFVAFLGLVATIPHCGKPLPPEHIYTNSATPHR